MSSCLWLVVCLSPSKESFGALVAFVSFKGAYELTPDGKSDIFHT